MALIVLLCYGHTVDAQKFSDGGKKAYLTFAYFIDQLINV